MNRKNLIKALDAARGSILIEVVYANRSMFMQGNRTDIKNQLVSTFEADEETGLTLQTVMKANYLTSEDIAAVVESMTPSAAAPADPVYEDVSEAELQAEDVNLTIAAVTYAAKFDYETRQFEADAA
jgi:hypothetical protein